MTWPGPNMEPPPSTAAAELRERMLVQAVLLLHRDALSYGAATLRGHAVDVDTAAMFVTYVETGDTP